MRLQILHRLFRPHPDAEKTINALKSSSGCFFVAVVRCFLSSILLLIFMLHRLKDTFCKYVPAGRTWNFLATQLHFRFCVFFGNSAWHQASREDMFERSELPQRDANQRCQAVPLENTNETCRVRETLPCTSGRDTFLKVSFIRCTF